MPLEPAATIWSLPDMHRVRDALKGQDLLAVGADLEPGTVLAAYRAGLFPMHLAQPELQDSEFPRAAIGDRQLGWWSPDPRGVLPLDCLHVSRSLRQSSRRFRFTVDQAFREVVAGCGARARPDGWINAEIAGAYQRLFELGWAHSVEVWRADRLVGGLYGVAIGGLFAGESMFHLVPDASKAALLHLVRDVLDDPGGAVGSASSLKPERLLDVQWVTPHLASLGARTVPRRRYLALLRRALDLPLPTAFGANPT